MLFLLCSFKCFRSPKKIPKSLAPQEPPGHRQQSHPVSRSKTALAQVSPGTLQGVGGPLQRTLQLHQDWVHWAPKHARVETPASDWEGRKAGKGLVRGVSNAQNHHICCSRSHAAQFVSFCFYEKVLT